MKIRFDQITAVIQGPYDEGVTERVIASVRKNLPGARIIFSTCDQSVPTTLRSCDELVISEDPGTFTYQSRILDQNVNRSIVNTLAGLRKVSSPYTLKIRSDILLMGNTFLKYFDRYQKAEEEYRVFSHKLLACSWFSRKPQSLLRKMPFHPSDLVFFGHTEDLLRLFNIPLMTKKEAYWSENNPPFPWRYSAEQYIWLTCLRENGFRADCDVYNDSTPQNIEQTERYFASNLIFLDYAQFNLRPLKQALIPNKIPPERLVDCYTHVEWIELYHKYVDPSIRIPRVDKTRDGVNTLFWRREKRIEQERNKKKFHKHAAASIAPFRSMGKWLEAAIASAYYGIKVALGWLCLFAKKGL